MAQYGRRTAFVEQGVYRAQSRSFKEILERATATAAWMSRQGLQGKRVIVWAKPGIGWAIAFYGCVLSGAVAVPIDAGFSAEFVARVREKTNAALTLCDSDFPNLDSFPAAPNFQPASASRDDALEIVFTSGTTSEPRGVVITHGNLLANLEPVEHEIHKYLWMAWPFSPIRFVNLIPLSHLFGQVMGLFIPQMLGGTVIFPEGQSPAFIAETIRRRRASVMVSVPQQVEALGSWVGNGIRSNSKGGRETSAIGALLKRWWQYRDVHRKLGWKMWAFIVGGAPLPPAVGQLWSSMGYAVIQGYGLTETAPAIAITHPFRSGGAGSVGIRLAGVETKLGDDGEILVRGPNVSPSAERDQDGWLHTGDLGRFDDAGNFYFIGRKKDVIVTANGLNVYPEDVERVLVAQPGVKEAAVVGKDVGGRATVHAVIVGKADIAAANAILEPHQRIQGLSTWPGDALPRTVSTKKLQRTAIAAWVNAPTVLPAGTPAPLHGWRDFLAKRGIAPERLTPGVRLEEDLGLTSLDRVELVTMLESEGDAPAPLRELVKDVAPQTPEPTWPLSLAAQALRALFRPLILFPLLRWYVKVEVSGTEKLSGLAGPAIFVANHQSYMDVPVILRALPPNWRAKLAPAMSPDHFDSAASLNLTRLCFAGFLLTADAEAVQSALRHAGRLLELGYSILIFPEGRLTPDGQIHKFRPGAGVMAERLGLPVVPVRIDGLYEIWPIHQHGPKKGVVRVTIGEPFKLKSSESAAEFVERLQSAAYGNDET